MVADGNLYGKLLLLRTYYLWPRPRVAVRTKNSLKEQVMVILLAATIAVTTEFNLGNRHLAKIFEIQLLTNVLG